MKKMHQGLLGLMALVLLCSTLLAGCTNNTAIASADSDAAGESSPQSTGHLDEILENGKIVVATSAYRPYQFHDENNELIGYNVDVAQMLADKIGVDLEWVEIPYPSLVPSLQNGQCDIVIACIYPTEERGEVVDFSEIYLRTAMRVVVREENSDITTIEDLNGKVVGVKAGADSERLAQALLDDGYDFEMSSYQLTEDYLIDIQNGRLDAVINDELFQHDYNRQFPGLKMVGEPLHSDPIVMCLNKGDDSLMEVVNDLIAQIEGDGTSESLYTKWITG